MFVETKRAGEAATVTEPWRSLLLDAADYIEKNGWCQGEWYQDGRVCAMGAMTQCSSGFDETFYCAKFMMSEHVGEMIEAWNDTYFSG